MVPRIVLASTSAFRRELLQRLQLPFDVASPAAAESPLADESPAATALRLAEVKARAVAKQFPAALIIGADQVAAHGTQRFGKPGSRDKAREQLRRMRGKEIVFHTGLCLLNSATGGIHRQCIPSQVGLRELTDAEIEAYLDKEDALDCAGSAKAEGLGIALLRHQRGDDPTALIGLPLIRVRRLLGELGVDVL